MYVELEMLEGRQQGRKRREEKRSEEQRWLYFHGRARARNMNGGLVQDERRNETKATLNLATVAFALSIDE